MKNKYKNKTTYRIVNKEPVKFDSKAEAQHFDKLMLLARAGKITELTLQPKFLLLDTLRVPEHKTMAKRYYIADFSYIENGQKIVVDVKSAITRKNSTYTLKKHLFLAKYGKELIFKEVFKHNAR